jgi:hypothetical protein
MNFDIAHHLNPKKKLFALPSNVKEIITSKLPKDHDFLPLIQKEAFNKLITDERNDFHFYDIPIDERVDEEIFYKTGYPDFKSVHKLKEMNEKKGIQTEEKFHQKLKFNNYEKEVRKQMSSTGMYRFLMREM